MNTTPQKSKSDVLHAFSVEANPNADTLARYLERYPQFREALIDLSIELHAAPLFDEVPAEAEQGDNAKQAWSTFKSMLSPTDPAAAAPRTVENPLSSLSDHRFRELADELNINRLFLSRLRDCSIQEATIPQRFLLRLAEALRVGVGELQNALEGPPSIASVLRHKAQGKPGTDDKISFEDALTQSGLSEKQQAALRSMKD
ncbi:MAG: hypothetical protein AAGI44_01435 [Pseudomonadota bacterium]